MNYGKEGSCKNILNLSSLAEKVLNHPVKDVLYEYLNAARAVKQLYRSVDNIEPAHPHRAHSLVERAVNHGRDSDHSHVTDVIVASLPPSVFLALSCGRQTDGLRGSNLLGDLFQKSLPGIRRLFLRPLRKAESRWERWRTGNGRRCCPSSTTGPTASLPGAARMDIRLNHRVCPLFCSTP